MNKKKILWFILILIFPALFNIFFFTLGGTAHNASVWISYGFIHFAYIMLVLTPLLTRKGKSAAVYGMALYAVSGVYFLIEFIVGLVFIIAAPASHTAALLVQLSIAGLYGLSLLMNLLANERTADAEG